jgi:hypothetical protein
MLRSRCLVTLTTAPAPPELLLTTCWLAAVPCTAASICIAAGRASVVAAANCDAHGVKHG